MGQRVFMRTVYQKNIRLEVEWIPRALNKRADCISQIVDWDDWQLNPSIVQQLDSK